jgi:hypothetical protein
VRKPINWNPAPSDQQERLNVEVGDGRWWEVAAVQMGESIEVIEVLSKTRDSRIAHRAGHPTPAG